MPIELGIWKMGTKVLALPTMKMDDESKLEDILEQDISIIDPDLLVIGRQVITDYGKRIDLLTINSEGHLCVIELKKDRTPRDVVAQVLDYGLWVKNLSYDKIVTIYQEYAQKQQGLKLEPEFEKAFFDKFQTNPPEELNQDHRLLIVASELDTSSERIVSYLSDYEIPINAVFFKCFRDENNQYLTRTWLLDPTKVEMQSVEKSKGKEVWNKRDFYVVIGEGEHGKRTWEDCQKYGFICAGGKLWYSNTLKQLFPGARIFVYLSSPFYKKNGYVGVGIVKEEMKPVKDFMVKLNGKSLPVLDAPLKALNMGQEADDPEKTEYVVRVDWIKTLPPDQAIYEKGMFTNQNSVCKLRNKFTLERLIERFGLEE